MFKVEAYIKPFMVAEILEGLDSADARILSCIELEAANHENEREPSPDLPLEKKVRIDVLVRTEALEDVVQLFKDHLGTQMRGGAEIIVLAVADVIDISANAENH